MSDATVRRFTGISGVSIGVGAVIAIPLYFIWAGPPPAWVVLTRNLIGILSCVALIVFVAGLSHLIRRLDAASEWIASLVNGAGLTFVAVTLVAISLEVGAIFGAPEGTVDPTIDGPLAQGAMLIHGSIGRALTVIFLPAAGYGARRARLVGDWLARAAYIVAGLNVAFVPSLYFGTDAARFYSAIGWGNSALVASFLAYWITAVGIVLLRRPRTHFMAPGVRAPALPFESPPRVHEPPARDSR